MVVNLLRYRKYLITVDKHIQTCPINKESAIKIIADSLLLIRSTYEIMQTNHPVSPHSERFQNMHLL